MCVCVRACARVCLRARALRRVHMHAHNFEAVLVHKNLMQSEFLPLGTNDSFASINDTIISSQSLLASLYGLLDLKEERCRPPAVPHNFLFLYDIQNIFLEQHNLMCCSFPTAAWSSSFALARIPGHATSPPSFRRCINLARGTKQTNLYSGTETNAKPVTVATHMAVLRARRLLVAWQKTKKYRAAPCACYEDL